MPIWTKAGTRLKNVRINDLAREWGLKSRKILNLLDDVGVVGKTHSSSLCPNEAAKVREHWKRGTNLITRGQEDFGVSAKSQRSVPVAIDLSGLITRPKKPAYPQSVIDPEIITDRETARGLEGMVTLSPPSSEALRRVMTDANKVVVKMVTCPACNRRVDLRKLPINLVMGRYVDPKATPRRLFFDCRVCKSPADQKFRTKPKKTKTQQTTTTRGPQSPPKTKTGDISFGLSPNVLPQQESKSKADSNPVVLRKTCDDGMLKNATDLHTSNGHSHINKPALQGLKSAESPFEIFNSEVRSFASAWSGLTDKQKKSLLSQASST